MCGPWRKSLICWASIFLFIGASLVFAQSQPPSPAPPKAGQKPETHSSQPTQKAKEKNNDSSEASLPITLNGPVTIEKSDRDRNDEREEGEHKASSDGWLVIWTGSLVAVTFLLAAITAFLARYTYKLWKSTNDLATQQTRDMQASLSIAQQSAGAAQMSAYAFTEAAKALLAVQRPYIFVVSVIHVEPAYSDHHVTYALVNYGGVPAIVEHMSVGIQESSDSRPVHPPLGVDQAHEIVRDPIILPQGKRELLQHYPSGIASDERARFFQIRVEYRGVFTQSHVTVSTWRFDRLIDSYAPFGGDKYNYTK